MAEEQGKTSEAQKEANRRYREKNKEKLKVGTYARTAKMFIREHSTLEDLAELEQMIVERRNELQ